MNDIVENISDTLPVMMYLHGFMSGANGAKQRQLQRQFKDRYRVIAPEVDICELFRQTKVGNCDVIIVDECQFMTPEQIDQLRAIVDDFNVPVLCFGCLLYTSPSPRDCS